MNLISSLIAGIRGAENGSVLLYKRGTTNSATWYGSFEGAAPNTSGAAITLDANGGAEVYVDELVDLVVRDSFGATVRSFTAGDSSPPVEVRSSSFTGVDYATAATAAGNPTTLQSALDLWLTQNGAIDWQVKFNGGPSTIRAALSMLNGKLFYNVKDDAYGATGNGSTDDTAAIQAAINAASAAGGGTVIFPAGTYKITVELSVSAGVSLWGAAPAGAIISTSSATAHILNLATGAHREISGLTLKASVSNSGSAVFVATTVNPDTHLQDCIFDGTNHTSYLTKGHGLTFEDCTWLIKPTSNAPGFKQQDVATSANRTIFNRCLFKFTTSGAYTSAAGEGVIASQNVVLNACTFDLANMSSGTAYMLACEAALYCTAIGNRVTTPAGGTVRLFRLGAVTKDVFIYEDFNLVEGSEGSSTLALYQLTSVAGAAASFWQGFWLGSRERNSLNIASDAASLDLAALQYALIINKRSNGTVQTITADANIPNGSLTLITKNATGGAGANITMDATDFRPSETFSIATNNNFDIRRWRCADGDGSILWFADAMPRNNV